MESHKIAYLKEVVKQAEFVYAKSIEALNNVKSKNVFNEIDSDDDSFYIINPIYKDDNDFQSENIEAELSEQIIDEIIDFYTNEDNMLKRNIIGFIITFGSYSDGGFFEYWEYDPIQIMLE